MKNTKLRDPKFHRDMALIISLAVRLRLPFAKRSGREADVAGPSSNLSFDLLKIAIANFCRRAETRGC